MRYPAQALEELKRLDPETPITLNYIRTLIARGQIPVLRIGRRQLINLDILIEYFDGVIETKQPGTEYGTIRRLPEVIGQRAQMV